MTDTAAYVLRDRLWCKGCGLPMVPALRRGTRGYRCAGTCWSGVGRWVDALLVECEAWDRLMRYRPELATASLPTDQRHAVVLAVTRRIEVDDDPPKVRIVWRPRQAGTTQEDSPSAEGRTR